MKSTRPLVLLASSLMVGGSLAMASPAAAGTVSSLIVTTESAPDCVEVVGKGKNWTQPYVDVKNTCKTTKRVKVVWAHGPDSECTSVKPGKTFRDQSGALARFDGLEKC